VSTALTLLLIPCLYVIFEERLPSRSNALVTAAGGRETDRQG
jgi:hypothetical protein